MFSFLLELIEFVLFCYGLRGALYLPGKKAQLHLCCMEAKKSGEVKGETTNWGQMVSSAGLSAALQSRRPAEFDEQNNVRPPPPRAPNGKIWGILVLERSRCVAKREKNI